VSKLQKNYSKYALMLKALSDETRIKIFDMLSQGELCACNILDEFEITQPTLSYHMKVLCESGLVNSTKDGVWIKYTIKKDSLEMIVELFDRMGANLRLLD
jgi:ArsR family transcriptional regulator, arsenate/arsenite/antimonite-responsive transcriptional repressor